MTKTIFTGKQVKKFANKYVAAAFRFIETIVPGFFKNLFMGYCPGNTGNWNCQQKKM